MNRPLSIDSIQKIVIKVGTRLITYETGKLNLNIIEKIVREIADLKTREKTLFLFHPERGRGIGRWV